LSYKSVTQILYHKTSFFYQIPLNMLCIVVCEQYINQILHCLS